MEVNIGVKRRYAEIRALKRWRVTSAAVIFTIRITSDHRKAAARRRAFQEVDKLIEVNIGAKRRRLAQIRAFKRWRVTSAAVIFAIRLTSDHWKAAAKRRAFQIVIERIFVVTNFVLEVPSAILDQLSSKHKTQYMFTAMFISVAILLICITELVFRARKGRVAWKWSQKIPWLYYPSPEHRPFGSLTDIIGLISAIFQCIFTAISYVLFCKHINNPIQVSIMPLVFAFCLLCSKFQKNSDDQNTTEIRHLRMA